MLREFVGTRRSFAAPEGDGGRRALRVFHEDAAGLHAANAPGGIAEEDDVACEAFHGKIFVDGADSDALGLGHYGIEGILRNGSAAGNGREAGAATRANDPVHAIAVEIGCVAAASAGDAFGQHFDDFVEVLSRKIAVGIGAAKEMEEFLFVPILGGAHGDDLLREDVQGGFGNGDAIEIALANGADERGGFEQVIAGGGKEPALGNCAAPVSGATNALQANGNGTRRADLADEVDAADIDAELQRRGGDQRAYFSGFEFLFRGEAQLARQASVVGSYRIASETFRQMMGDALRQAPRVDEDQRRRMLPGELGDAVVNFAPHLIRGNRAKLAARNFDGDVHLALVADVYYGWCGAFGAGEEVSDHFDWLLRGGEANAREAFAGQMIEALERQREMSAALVVGDGMDFVDDHVLDGF